MPKKFGGNTKAEEARARKEETQQRAKAKAAKDAEDELWKDDDKQVNKKLQRKVRFFIFLVDYWLLG